MLVINKISKSFDSNVVLSDVSASLLNGEKVGVVGANGSGKTTLINIISGIIKQDSGQIEISEKAVLLPQVLNFDGKTVEEFLKTGIKNEEDSYLIDISLSNFLPEVSKSQLASSLSEGQKTKIYLAYLTLYSDQNSILILDEPTNNLDHDGLLWLEDFVNSYQGSMVIISHDRYFLDKTVNKIWHIENANLTSYSGNYSDFIEKRLKERENQLKKYEQNQKEIKRLERLIYAKKEAARRIANEKEPRDNDKFAKYFFGQKSSTIDRQAKNFESRLEHLGSEKKPDKRKDYDFGFLGQVDNSKLILRVKDLSAFYDKQIFKPVSFEIRGGERVQIVGANGSGKSTLIKVLLSEGIKHTGTFEFGNSVKFGYFSQNADGLNYENTAIDELKPTGANLTDCFTFSSYMHLNDEDLRKKIKKLSRGQIAKLAFVKLLLSDLQLLILDEPTNHLDVETREDIESALVDYKGSILFISHDRYFSSSLNPEIVLSL